MVVGWEAPEIIIRVSPHLVTGFVVGAIDRWEIREAGYTRSRVDARAETFSGFHRAFIAETIIDALVRFRQAGAISGAGAEGWSDEIAVTVTALEDTGGVPFQAI